MTKYLLKCVECKKYGLPNDKSKCRYCGGRLASPKPPKFSLTDKWAKYRMQYFKEEFEKKFE